jgi:hypothetical protein
MISKQSFFATENGSGVLEDGFNARIEILATPQCCLKLVPKRLEAVGGRISGGEYETSAAVAPHFLVVVPLLGEIV